MNECRHFRECGGCLFQHLPYEEQLKIKQNELEKIFSNHSIEPILPCKNPWNYRNKMEFSFSQNKAGDRFLGLFLKKGRGKVLNVEECPISPPWFSEVLQKVRNWWEKTDLSAFHFRKGEGALRTLTLREGKRTGDRLAMLTVSGDSRFALTRSQLNGFIEAVGEMSVFLRIQQATAGRPTEFFEMHLRGPDHIREKLTIQGREFVFKISPTSFFQPNTEQAEVLYNTALEMAHMQKDSIVFDLYCGTATLGIGFSMMSKKVIGIELNKYAIFDAKMNAEQNGVENLELHAGDVGKVVSEMGISEPDLVIVDPPRAGLDPLAMASIKKLNPKKILYISCNPLTQAKNVMELPEYQTIKVQPVDQFPHTPHIENIVLLER